MYDTAYFITVHLLVYYIKCKYSLMYRYGTYELPWSIHCLCPLLLLLVVTFVQGTYNYTLQKVFVGYTMHWLFCNYNAWHM